MKLFTQYNRANLVITGILLVLAAVGYYLVINSIFIHELDEELLDYKYKIATFSRKNSSFPEQGALEDLKVEFKLTNKTSSAIHFSMSNKYDSDEHAIQNFRQLGYIQKIGNSNFEVIISKPLEGIHLLTKTIIIATLTILAIIILVSFLLNQFVLKQLWKPFYKSVHILKNFKLSTTSPLIFPTTKIDEFSFLNANLSSTIEAARKDYFLLKEFTENASHEMQTPLAIIRSRMDLIIQEENLSEKQVHLLNSVYSAVKRLSKLSHSLLLLAKIENNQYTHVEKIDLKDEISEKINQFQDIWESKGISLISHLDECYIEANPDLVDILLNNLLVNAGLHNFTNGQIIIHLTKIQFTIQNTGISQSLEKEQLYRRFYKSDSGSPHNGLGLSIIKQICDQSRIQLSYSFTDNFHSFTLAW